MAIPGRFSGRASDRSVTVWSEEMKNEMSSMYLTNARSNMKRSDGFVHYGKRNQKNLGEVCCKERKASKESVGKLWIRKYMAS